MGFFIPGAGQNGYVEDGDEFRLGDTRYPAGWLTVASQDELDAIGATKQPLFDGTTHCRPERNPVGGWFPPQPKAAADLAGELEDTKSSAIAEIKAQASACRDRVRTPGKDAIYREKLDEADRWTAAGQPDDVTEHPWISAEIGATGATPADVVAVWRTRAALWLNSIGPAIERTELTACAAIRTAADATAIRAIVAGLTWPA